MNVERRNALATRIVLLCLCFLSACIMAGLKPIPLLYVDGISILQTKLALTAFGSSYEASAYLLSPLFDVLRTFGVRLDGYGQVFDDDQFIVNVLFGGMFFLGVAVVAMSLRVRSNLVNVVSFGFFLLALSPFFFCISKELVPAWVAVVALTTHRLGWLGRRGMFAFYVGLILLCGFYFRIYYLCFAGLLWLNWTMDGRRKNLLLFYLLGAGALVVLYDKLPLDLINKGRASYLEGVSNSRIRYLFPDNNGIGFVSNRVLTLLQLLLPVSLLAISPSYLPYVVLQCLLTWMTLRQLRYPSRDLRSMAAHVLLAFTIVGALFEPDFGSYFRHKIGVLPFLLLVVADFEWKGRETSGVERARRIAQEAY
ncbi:hypothetical protein [Dyella mobilis]|uniref:EpsG family protein n=1 Tax=Dyella mobilis TaxID=1849582 RepID=A0ABS2KFA6_9GAMM|nr:hypothetical protein [Dyella mobilis]MBM7129840.1 hypothetical protein [Dyella mobilis]GLQ97896.1 hypothetical protein GCM10007863_23160 [Dyella mobilis]